MFDSGNQSEPCQSTEHEEENKDVSSTYAQYKQSRQQDQELRNEPYSIGVSNSIAGRLSKENNRKQSQAN